MEELERELLRMLTSELGELRIMVCRSKLCSDSGEMGRGRFRLGREGSRGLEKREPGGNKKKRRWEQSEREREREVDGKVWEGKEKACLTASKLQLNPNR